jgi:capsular polysaccharide biosynthesis protein
MGLVLNVSQLTAYFRKGRLKGLYTGRHIKVIECCFIFIRFGVQRKIANENELIQSITEKHRGSWTVRGVQIDLFPVTEQLRIIGETDVLVAMHGAGLSHVLFMPRHGALIELEPRSQSANTHFADLALWRGLFYRRWKNTDSRNEVSVHRN